MPRTHAVPATLHRTALATSLVAAIALAGCAILPEPSGEQVRAGALGTVAIPPNWSARGWSRAAAAACNRGCWRR